MVCLVYLCSDVYQVFKVIYPKMARKSWSSTESDGSCSSYAADLTIESDTRDTRETFHKASSFFTSGEVVMLVVESDPVVAVVTEGNGGEMGSSEASGNHVEESVDYSAGGLKTGNSAIGAETGQASFSQSEDFQFLQPLPVSPAVSGSRRRGGRRGGRSGVRGRRAVGVGDVWTSGRPLVSSDDQLLFQFLASQSQAARAARGGHLRRARARARATRPLGRSDRHLFPEESASSFSWTGISLFAGQREQFVPEKAGPTAEYLTPYDAFRAIWTDEILDKIVEKTNKYSGDSRRHGHQRSPWRGTNRHEILILFAFYTMLGIIRMPSVRSCFSTTWIMKTSVFRKLLSINRFRELTKYLHFTDNDLIHTNPENKKLFFVKRLLNVSIHNAKILHSRSQSSEVFTNLKFRLALVQRLASHHLTLSRPPKSTRQSFVGPYTDPFPLSPNAHYPDYNDSPQATDANDPAPLKRGRTQYCVICKKSKVRKSTVYCCKTCRVPLCVVPCFEKYHTTLH